MVAQCIIDSLLIKLIKFLKILCTTALKSAILEIAPNFEMLENIIIDFHFGPTTALLQEMNNRIDADIVILTQEGIDSLINANILQAPRTDIASTAIGVAMKAGTPKPDISTTEHFKKFLLDAPSLAYTSDGVSGMYVAELIKHLKLTDSLASKTKRVKGGYAGDLIIKGEAAYALQNISELRPVSGLEVVGPLPSEYQRTTMFSAALTASSKRDELSAAFLMALAAPSAHSILKSNGLEPISNHE